MARARQSQNGVVAANGVGELIFRPTAGQNWVFQQAGVKAGAGAAGAIGEIFVNTDFITPFVPTGDAPSGEPFPEVHNGDKIRIRWTGATAGTSIQATIIYDDGNP